ncbi:hypothetical protein GO755_01040 [Spirosoma sp. HMF4905]|uniref:Uncharacterized protein n=1 Tax=Spirosoma arboris TaxID=2682092 RepID=A0A7K1S451_9BACT|nr:hypothetical protein [Spirosoma arboris]MVM28597.1 hypothetical protein [Spirosoma arboris]
MTIYSVYDQVADLLATLDPAKVLSMKASADMQIRFEELAEKSADDKLTKAEKDELDHYIVLERLMRLAKIRAQSGRVVS